MILISWNIVSMDVNKSGISASCHVIWILCISNCIRGYPQLCRQNFGVIIQINNINNDLSIRRPAPTGKNTGCVTISVKSDTPLFSDICQWIMLPFHALNKQCLRFDILKKKFKFHFRSGSGPGTRSVWVSGSAWFAASSNWRSPRVVNFFAWKPLHMVNLTSKRVF